MTGQGVEIWRGGVNPWDCDAMGHMNVRHYVARAMEGLVTLAADMGMPRAFSAQTTATLRVREHHIRFLREAHAGDSLHMTGGVLEIGEADARLLQIITHAASGQPAAVFQTLVEHVAPQQETVFPWPARIREAAKGLMLEVPNAVRPRSLQPAAADVTASLERARAMGIERFALGAVGPQDCDVFGRMRTEGVMARISEGAAHYMVTARDVMGEGEAASLGSAAVEFRLVYERWPRAGDRVAVHSGLAAADARSNTLVHWVLDPETGDPWAAAEHVVILFDMATRKMVKPPTDAAAKMRAGVIAGLTL